MDPSRLRRLVRRPERSPRPDAALIADLEARLAAAARQADEDRERIAALERALGDWVERSALEARLARLIDANERAVAVSLDGDDVLVSVVLPTHDRPAHLRRAIASVLTQLHRRLELIVVDTGGTAETAAVLDAVDDERVRVVRAVGARSAAARNAGLDAARGEVVAYVDDDNVMLPWWLRAVAVVARTRPDVDVVYGARVFEERPATAAVIDFEPTFDRAVLAERNIVDTNALAHRRGLGPRWPDHQPAAPDWEFVARLVAAGHEPLPLPVRCVVYCSTAPGRTSQAPGIAERWASTQRVVAELLR